VVASEKTAIQTAFNVNYEDIQEIKPGHALVVDKAGNYSMDEFIEPLERKSCSFERIYFSRGSDPQIYAERKKLGKLLIPQILEAIDYDLENTVFSYIPNTAETSFLGMMEGMEEHLAKRQLQELKSNRKDDIALEKLLSFRPRVEKLVIKDAKLRTFITDDAHRDELVAHVYDTTYEVIRKKVDTVVVIDDSIVRGTTLEKSILKMLDRLEPKKIIIVSSAPQIRFPDCYGIDMSKMKEFIAFRAVLALLKESKQENILDDVYQKCLKTDNSENHIKEVFRPFSYVQISNKIAELIKTDGIIADVEVIYQTVDNLHKACPDHLGDWYFTGDFPTIGGNKVVNRAFVNFMEGKEVRAY
jgi:amidophosphoribosyltransferase